MEVSLCTGKALLPHVPGKGVNLLRRLANLVTSEKVVCSHLPQLVRKPNQASERPQSGSDDKHTAKAALQIHPEPFPAELAANGNRWGFRNPSMLIDSDNDT
jgi:hypothetical protein